ncbi:MAG TPA: hypothetical protein VGL13_10900 [Polyangiaceae bacterium]|jgi:hypothetical protein
MARKKGIQSLSRYVLAVVVGALIVPSGCGKDVGDVPPDGTTPVTSDSGDDRNASIGAPSAQATSTHAECAIT